MDAEKWEVDPRLCVFLFFLTWERDKLVYCEERISKNRRVMYCPFGIDPI